VLLELRHFQYVDLQMVRQRFATFASAQPENRMKSIASELVEVGDEDELLTVVLAFPSPHAGGSRGRPRRAGCSAF
jgi:hypothetical protein